MRRILRECVEDVGQQQFLVLLFMMQADFDNRENLRAGLLVRLPDQALHSRIDMGAIGPYLFRVGTGDQAALRTRMARVPSLCYLQYRNESGNTHRQRNQEIQRLVRYFADWYDVAIHDRLLELGVEDFVWKAGENTFARLQRVPSPATESHCTVTVSL